MDKKQPLEYRYVFGPVPSRRLGLSLGVDLMPHKTCTLDCVYCECGKTTRLTLDRQEYIPLDQLQKELAAFLSEGPNLDYITFSGSGEPTLHSGVGEMVRFIKTEFPRYQVALLTNGTLFYQEEVRRQLRDVDLVIASLDAVTEPVFSRVNRPHPRLSLDAIVEGLVAFRKEHAHRLWMEVFLAPDVNDGAEELCGIRDVLRRIAPDKVQLNTLDRPGTENWVTAADKATMDRAAACIHMTELIAKPGGQRLQAVAAEDVPGQMLATIRRRPCTAPDMGRMFGIEEAQVQEHLFRLLADEKIEKKQMPRGTFYFAIEQ